MKTLSDQLRDVLKHKQLTIYDAAQVVGVQTDTELKAAHKRLMRYLSGNLPQSLQQFVETCEALGYDVVLKDSGKYL